MRGIKVFLLNRDECLQFFESNEFTVSLLICVLAREKLCEGKDESSNAEESQLGFMSTQTPVQKHIITHTKHPHADRPSQCLDYSQARDEMPDLANDHSVIHAYSYSAHTLQRHTGPRMHEITRTLLFAVHFIAGK